MMKHFFSLFFCLFVFNYLHAQTLKAYEKAANKAFEQNDYYAAMLHLSDALEVNPEKASLQFQYAEVCRQFNAYEIAEEYYSKVLENEEGGKFPMTKFWLGQVKKSLGKYSEAKTLFEAFSNENSDDDYYSNWAKKEIETCDWAMNLQPTEDFDIQINHLNKKINTPYSEIGALGRGDTLFYSSLRYDNKNDKHKPPRKITKMLISKNGAKGRTIPSKFNHPEKHTAHTSFNSNGKRIYFTLCEYVSGAKIRCDIYYKEKARRNRWKKEAVKIPGKVNMPNFTSTHPAVGFDSLSQKEVLFFVSDRTGGKGKLDIWYSEIDGKKFSEPKNLEVVNTPENDLTPFFHDNSQNLYFSSDGQAGLGGYDIYKVSKTENWGEIENLGVPINSSYHDLYYSLNSNSERAYLSSNRPGSFYLDKNNKACCYDIFQADFIEPDPIEPDEPVVEIPEPEPEIKVPAPPLVPETLEDFLPLALYFDNDEPDKRTRRTFTKKDYPTTFEKYYSKKQEYISEFILPVSEEDKYEAEAAVEDFFEDEVKKGFDHLFLFSEILLKRLENGDEVEIFIKGFTSPRAKSDYNLSLGKRRVSSLRNHFDKYENGIFKEYIDSGKLKISETSFGETQSAKDVSDVLDDLRGSIYHPAAARERRVEIVEIKTSINDE